MEALVPYGGIRIEAMILPMPESMKAARPRWHRPFSVGAEFCVALLLSIAAAPIVLFAALLVKLTSRGPAFYSQTRLGRRGRPYKIFKLRTMLHNCEKHSGPC